MNKIVEATGYSRTSKRAFRLDQKTNGDDDKYQANGGGETNK
jgi:hypothetical protein